MNLEKLREKWKEDSKIDNNDLAVETVKTSQLHSEYLNELSECRLKYRSIKFELDILFKQKWLYYNGKLTKEEIDKHGWKYDPFNGMSKPLKGDMDMWFKTDDDLILIEKKLAILDEKIKFIEEIINTIRWRHQSIKNIIEFQKFTAGY